MAPFFNTPWVESPLGRSDLRNLKRSDAATLQVQIQRNEIELAAKFTARRLIDSGTEQSSKVEELLTKFHFDREAIGVSENLQCESQVLRDGAVDFKVERLASSGKVVECSILLRRSDPFFHDSVEESHATILPTLGFERKPRRGKGSRLPSSAGGGVV
jgi:hypothetical protein